MLATGGSSGRKTMTYTEASGQYEYSQQIPSGVCHIALLLYTGDVTLPANIGFRMITDAYASKSYVNQMADEVTLGVKNDLSDTGIDITQKKIKFRADNVQFCDSNGNPQSFVEITSDGKIKATDGEFKGKVTATSGRIGGFEILTYGTVDYARGNIIASTVLELHLQLRT